ncbi:MAG: amidophosphoribosyltransferase [Chloroflexi bacterium]|nr:amidophosphoribosyltransferase [Chloroflexota bacterium]
MKSDALREACGVFGIYAPGLDVARVTFFGLYSLQHRGQESAGIAVSDGERIHRHVGMGWVSQVFTESILAPLRGTISIGHTRYSTTGSSNISNAQPILLDSPLGPFALAHNGNIINGKYLRARLMEQGCSFDTTTDSEIIARQFATAPGNTWVQKIRYGMREIQGAYSLAMLTPHQLIAIRDPLGMRPLCLGKVYEGWGWAVASESCALETIGARFDREIEPGEILIIDPSGARSFQGQRHTKRALCIFEYIYFARPDSVINNRLLHLTRQEMGAQLAREYPVDADLVIAIPDSATAAGIGYARESGVPFGEGLIKSRYIGRTFIQPDQRLRELGVRLKFNPLLEVLGGKRVVVVDDSIVRGTTTPRVVSLLKKAGVTEVHLRICAPPIRYPCFFGVDMATREELIAARKNVEAIRQFLGATTLGYLSLEGLIKAVGLPRDIFCTACFTGEYPFNLQLEMDKLVAERPPTNAFPLKV